jgi:hypothetical protein
MDNIVQAILSEVSMIFLRPIIDFLSLSLTNQSFCLQ